MSTLQIQAAEVRLGNTRVLRGIDLNVAPQTCTALLGPSGCGKTTLLNVIAGAVALDKGSLYWGEQVLDLPAEKKFLPMNQRGFAMVFQDFSLWPHMTVAENVAFGLKIRKLNRSDRETKVKDALQKVRMEKLASRKPASLSGGQQQRVSIARALAVQPKLLLFDEPLSALDAKLREELKAELKLLLLETGQTAVYVTHDQAEAYTLGDQVALMNAGRVEQIGAPERIYHHPRNAYVAGFLGAANVLPYRQQNGRLEIEDIGHWPVRKDFPESGLCFLRREDVHFETVGEHLNGTCLINQFLGSHYALEARFGLSQILHGHGKPGLKPGTPVRAVCDVHKFGFLSPENSYV
ncbi:ABC transporter ATP-binding protein [Kiritimatiellaeota bacterium B1221]|nr:ABC transporter ATP-binding protein [Kiritimatiellaeota bacterium B1221]